MRTVERLVDFTLTAQSCDLAFIRSEGVAERLTVCENTSARVENGGRLEDFTIRSASSVDDENGLVTVSNGGIALGGKIFGVCRVNSASLDDSQVGNGGFLQAYDSRLSTITVSEGGRLNAQQGTILDGLQLQAGGTAYCYQVAGEEVTVQSGARFIVNGDSALAELKVAAAAQTTLVATLTIDGLLLLGNAVDGEQNLRCDKADVRWDLSERRTDDTALMANFANFADAEEFSANVSARQREGSYVLANGVNAFAESVDLWKEGAEEPGKMVLGKELDCGLSRYSLELSGSSLSLHVRNAWDVKACIAGTEVVVQGWKSNGEVACIYASASAPEISAKEYFASEEEYAEGRARWIEVAQEPARIVAKEDGLADILVAEAAGKWDAGYLASNVFSGEVRKLTGMNRFDDVFIGAVQDANALALTSGNDALFLDDIYSAMPADEESKTRAVIKNETSGRVSRIQAIYAGAGDDLVDLTSARFGCDDSIAVYGGAGNDILWGGGNGCRLFGGEGDDSLAGTAGNDILAGGSGNDAIQCLGGEDILCFGPDWGNDLAIQQEGGKVTLWFAEGDERFWDADKLIYSDGFSSVQVAGVGASDVTLKFGNDSCPVYALFRGQGASLA